VINGRVGRAKVMARIRREREAEARAMGVDPKNRAAFRAWEQARSAAFWNGLSARLKQDRQP
jgi:hypothetical protein